MNKQPGGFTLIELMISVLIIILFTGASIAAYFNFSQRQSVVSDGRAIAAELSSTRSLASNLVYPPGCVNLTSYILKNESCSGLAKNCKKISISAVCSGVEVVVKNNVTVFDDSYFISPINVRFEAGTGRVLNGNGIHEIYNENTGVTYKLILTIDLNGVIVVSEPSKISEIVSVFNNA